MRPARIARRTSTLLALLVSLALVAGSPAAEIALGAGQGTGRVKSLTNKERKDHGRKALKLNKRLSKYALRHSKHMANQGGLFHTSDLGKVLRHVNWRVAGENVGAGGTLPAIQNAFMDSAPHRKNILNKKFDHSAVGVVQDDGRFWVTVIFYG
ncbi:MAG: CAP domain-containing protein [Actinomycetota bacterium]